jgi:hypothetical protein
MLEAKPGNTHIKNVNSTTGIKAIIIELDSTPVYQLT